VTTEVTGSDHTSPAGRRPGRDFGSSGVRSSAVHGDPGHGTAHELCRRRVPAPHSHAGGLDGSAQHFLMRGGCDGPWRLRGVDAGGDRPAVAQIESRSHVCGLIEGGSPVQLAIHRTAEGHAGQRGRRPKARYPNGPNGWTTNAEAHSNFGPRTACEGRRIRSRSAMAVRTSSTAPPAMIADLCVEVRSAQDFFSLMTSTLCRPGSHAQRNRLWGHKDRGPAPRAWPVGGLPLTGRPHMPAGSGRHRNTWASACDGGLSRRVCRGRPLSSSAMASKSAWVNVRKSSGV